MNQNSLTATMRAAFIFPIVIVLLSINLVVFDRSFYEENTSANTTYANEPKNLISFFKGEDLNTTLYTDREVQHLYDVRQLIWISLIVLGFLTVLTATLLWKTKNRRKEWLWGGIFTLILTGIIALSLFSFSEAFVIFHKLIFMNDLWLLPKDATLIHLFPQTFFVTATKQILLYSTILSLLLVSIGARWQKKNTVS